MTPRLVWPIFVLAIMVVGAAAPLAKVDLWIHPMSLSFWRLGLAFVFLSLLNRQSLPRAAWWMTGWAGVALALHFMTWFASLHYTSVVRSTLLVCLTPFWTGVWKLVRREDVSPWYWRGLCLALVGVWWMGDKTQNTNSLLGDGLAVFGGVLGAVYLLLSESVRRDTENVVYAQWVCGVAAIVVLGVILMTGNVGVIVISPSSSWIVLGMALGPQILGHAGLSYSMRWIAAQIVGLGLLAEPVVAGILAWVFLSEPLTIRDFIGGGLILIGLFMGMMKAKHQSS